MPDLDWLTGKDFKKEIVIRAHSTTQQLGFKTDTSVTVFLLFMLNKYHVENKQLAGEFNLLEVRTPEKALAAVDILLTEAARFADSRNSKTIDITDITKAHSTKYSIIWPFCGKKKHQGFILLS